MRRYDPKAMGRRLADARALRGYTQREAAAALKMTQPALCRIEVGKIQAPGVDTVAAMAVLYRKSLDSLILGPRPR